MQKERVQKLLFEFSSTRLGSEETCLLFPIRQVHWFGGEWFTLHDIKSRGGPQLADDDRFWSDGDAGEIYEDTERENLAPIPIKICVAMNLAIWLTGGI